MFGEPCARLECAWEPVVGPAICYYEQGFAGDGSALARATMPGAVAPGQSHDSEVVDLPAMERAATGIHWGDMNAVLELWQGLGQWLADNGYRSGGSGGEVTLVYSEDAGEWVTEIQERITKA